MDNTQEVRDPSSSDELFPVTINAFTSDYIPKKRRVPPRITDFQYND